MAAAMPALAKDHGRGNGRGGGPDWSEHRGGRGHMRAEHRRGGEERGRARSEGHWRGDDGEGRRLASRQHGRERGDDDRRRFVRHEREDRRWERGPRQRLERIARSQGVGRDGCPPGLARQNRQCMPPGQLRRAAIGQRADLARFAPVPDAWAYRFRDDANAYYRYGDDNVVYRIDRGSNSVASVIPLLASGLAVGDSLPLGFDSYNLPLAYRDNYVDGSDALYRYDDGAIYQVDPQSRMIEGIVALLGGNPLSVGSPVPPGYDAYNLPPAYRDNYVDDADSLYRYSNGSIFEIDPQTMLVRALVEMIV
jgi:dipeptidyl aminopeptidase/acylaminoacyl peptidase